MFWARGSGEGLWISSLAQFGPEKLQPSFLKCVVNVLPLVSLCAVVGGFQPHEQTMAQAGAQQQSAQPAGFTRPAQPYFNGRGAPRGGPRGGRGIINGYRGGASNGFRGTIPKLIVAG